MIESLLIFFFIFLFVVVIVLLWGRSKERVGRMDAEN